MTDQEQKIQRILRMYVNKDLATKTISIPLSTTPPTTDLDRDLNVNLNKNSYRYTNDYTEEIEHKNIRMKAEHNMVIQDKISQALSAIERQRSLDHFIAQDFDKSTYIRFDPSGSMLYPYNIVSDSDSITHDTATTSKPTLNNDNDYGKRKELLKDSDSIWSVDVVNSMNITNQLQVLINGMVSTHISLSQMYWDLGEQLYLIHEHIQYHKDKNIPNHVFEEKTIEEYIDVHASRHHVSEKELWNCFHLRLMFNKKHLIENFELANCLKLYDLIERLWVGLDSEHPILNNYRKMLSEDFIQLLNDYFHCMNDIFKEMNNNNNNNDAKKEDSYCRRDLYKLMYLFKGDSLYVEQFLPLLLTIFDKVIAPSTNPTSPFSLEAITIATTFNSKAGIARTDSVSAPVTTMQFSAMVKVLSEYLQKTI